MVSRWSCDSAGFVERQPTLRTTSTLPQQPLTLERTQQNQPNSQLQSQNGKSPKPAPQATPQMQMLSANSKRHALRLVPRKPLLRPPPQPCSASSLVWVPGRVQFKMLRHCKPRPVLRKSRFVTPSGRAKPPSRMRSPSSLLRNNNLLTLRKVSCPRQRAPVNRLQQRGQRWTLRMRLFPKLPDVMV